MWYLGHRKYENWAYHTNLFTEEECDKIVEYSKTLNVTNGSIKDNKVDKEIRDNTVRWVEVNAETEWIHRRLTDGVLSINQEFWNFDLEYIESLQFTEYTKVGHHYYPHLDIGNNMTTYRKLSFSLQLSDENDYLGSDLRMHVGGDPQVGLKQKGSVNYFPSYTLHEVTPLIRGTRYALVGWVSGPDFK